MDENRIAYWIEEIQRLPEFEANRTGDDRLRWLNLHIFEYVERWSGFAGAECMNVKATIANDLFYLIIAAINLVNRLVKTGGLSTTFPHAEWERFTSTVDFIQEDPRKENVQLFTNAFVGYLEVCKTEKGR